MQDQDPSQGVKIKTSTFQRLSLVVAILFFGMAILGIVGEVLGWWNDVGELLTTVGTLGGLIVSWTSLTAGSTEAQVDRVYQAVVDNGEQLEKLDSLDAIQLELDRQTGVLGEQLAVLTDVRDRL